MAWNPISDYLSSHLKSPKERFYGNVKELKDKLLTIRNILKTDVDQLHYLIDKQPMSDHSNAMREEASRSNDMMSDMSSGVIHKAIDLMTEVPPCSFAVGIGSLGRGDDTPYSDIIQTVLRAPCCYFFFGSLRETKLSSLDIEELKGWFTDGRIQIDGITETS